MGTEFIARAPGHSRPRHVRRHPDHCGRLTPPRNGRLTVATIVFTPASSTRNDPSFASTRATGAEPERESTRDAVVRQSGGAVFQRVIASGALQRVRSSTLGATTRTVNAIVMVPLAR
jgi:hypothetical protein